MKGSGTWHKAYSFTALYAIFCTAMRKMSGDGDMRESERERSYEYGLPGYLQNDLDAYKNALLNGSNLFDCLWGELYGSINAAEISDGAITPEHADYLRKKYLWGDGN